MKILMLNYEFPPFGGGAASVSKELAIHLVQRGHDVDVITMGGKKLPAYEEIEGVHVHRVRCVRTRYSSCQPWEQYTYVLSTERYLKGMLNEREYDLCHVHFVVPTGLIAYRIRKRYGLKYMITAHGSDVEGYNTRPSNQIMHKLIRSLWKKIVMNAEITISPSKYLLKKMKKNCPKGQYRIIPNGIDMEKYKKNVFGKKEKKILFVGRLQRSKNVQLLIKAVSSIDMKGWTVDIVGDGPYRKNLEYLVQSLHLEKVVRFHGWVLNGSKKHLVFLKNASLFVSESYFESFGVAVVEAIASGCSVLLSNIDVHRDIVKETNCFTDPEDVNALSKKLSDFINGRETFMVDVSQVERYAWEAVVDHYEKEYERICHE